MQSCHDTMKTVGSVHNNIISLYAVSTRVPAIGSVTRGQRSWWPLVTHWQGLVYVFCSVLDLWLLAHSSYIEATLTCIDRCRLAEAEPIVSALYILWRYAPYCLSSQGHLNIQRLKSATEYKSIAVSFYGGALVPMLLMRCAENLK